MRDKKQVARKAEAEHRHLLDHLQALLPVYARNRQAALGDLIGRGKNYVQKMLKGNPSSPKLDELLRILAGLGVEPEDFVAGAREGRRKRFHLDFYLRRLEGRNRRQVRYLRELLARPPASSPGLAELCRRAAGLEELRFTDRKSARKEALELVRALRHESESPERAEAEAEALRILGVISRLRGKYSASAFCHRSALDVAWAHDLVTAEARVLQAVGYLLMDMNEFAEAHAVVLRAAGLYLERVDLPGLGRTLVDLGVQFVNQGKLREAGRLYEGGLAVLLAKDWHNRFCAFQGLGLVKVGRGELESAREQLEKAAALLRVQNREAPDLEAWCLWLGGEIALKKGEAGNALRTFLGLGSHYFRAEDLGNTLMISLRVCKVLFRGGCHRELADFAVGMARLLAPLEREAPVLAGALQQLISAAVSGQTSDAILEACYEAWGASSCETPLVHGLVSWREL